MHLPATGLAPELGYGLQWWLPENPEGLVAIEMEPFIVRALRVARGVAANPESFESLLGDLDTQKEQAENIFAREMAALENSDRLLEDKFAEALRRAEEDPDDSPPLRPIDLE